ncbi:MAG TPA: radical SAM protein [Syntrophorhabdaceae bacterium]|nr:radical SAM protein [Syntrophorhabdaceae bacterium]
MNLTLSVSYTCNSHCKTCNIHERKARELSLNEWQRVFESLGKSPFWITMSGGEPFLRKDLPELVRSLYDRCSPALINIPTNGLLADRIIESVKEIALYCEDAEIVINVSVDEVREKHDAIRGVAGSYEKALKTFHALKDLRLNNLSVGIHTVISRFNVDRIPDVYSELRTLNPDSYITEIAEEREELRTINSAITPAYESYARAVDYLIEKLKRDRFNKIGRITRAFRIEYYEMVKKVLSKRRPVIPCYAGFASAQVAPDGDVWMCCVKAESAGNLREFDYDFEKLWFSDRAQLLRQDIRKRKCYCPLANASYTSMLHSIGSLSRVGWNYLRMH